MGNKVREWIKCQLSGGNSSRWQLFGYTFYYLFIPGRFPKWCWNSCWSDGPLALFFFSLQAVLGRLVSIHFRLSSFGLQVSPSVTCIWKGTWCQGPEASRAAAHSFLWLLSARTCCQSARAWARPHPCTDRPLGVWQGNEPVACNLQFATQSHLTNRGRAKLRE